VVQDVVFVVDLSFVVEGVDKARAGEGVAEWVAEEFWWSYVGEPSAAVLNRAAATQTMKLSRGSRAMWRS